MLWVKTHLIFKTVILGIATMSRGGMGYQLGEEINLISILPCNEGCPDTTKTSLLFRMSLIKEQVVQDLGRKLLVFTNFEEVKTNN